MALSPKQQANNEYRAILLKKIYDFCCSKDIGGSSEWVRQTSNNSFAFPFVNSLGDEGVIKITISIPKGDRTGEPYDYDAEADDFLRRQKEKAIIKEKKEQLKNKKIIKDQKEREILKKQKQKREEHKNEPNI